MNESIFILKGNIVYSKSQTEFAICEHGYLVCRDGKVDGIYAETARLTEFTRRFRSASAEIRSGITATA